MKDKKILLKLYVSGLIIVPMVLLILPADFFDNGQSICLSVLILDKECYGCGITRAIQHLIHFDFKAAAAFNKLAFIITPILLYFWFDQLKQTIKKIKTIA